MVKPKTEATNEPEQNLVSEYIAEYVTQAFIKEDVNAFAESCLLQELLAYKINESGKPMMLNTIRALSDTLEKGKRLDLKKRAGGITQARRITFRSDDQYNAFVSLFFQAMEENPGLARSIDREEDFETFMIYCIYEFKETLDNFAAETVKERLAIEHKNRLYYLRSNKAEALEDIPSYADFIAARFDDLAKPGEA